MQVTSEPTAATALVTTVAGRVGPAVVGLGRGWSAGSGVVVAPGRVLTVAHALNREETAVAFADGRRADARVLAVDGDLAVLETDTGDVAPVELGGEHPGLAAPVVALADPGGRGLRATLGFVSTAARVVRGPRGRRLDGAVEHTAPLPRGSSGGPLVDADGRLIGLNAVRSGGGLILAVPADRDRVEQLVRGEAPQRVELGVALAPPRAARRLRQAVGLPERDGVLVRGVRDDSAAARAGIQRGDLLVAAGAKELTGIDALQDVLGGLSPGAELTLTLVRGVDEQTVTVTL